MPFPCGAQQAFPRGAGKGGGEGDGAGRGRGRNARGRGVKLELPWALRAPGTLTAGADLFPRGHGSRLQSSRTVRVCAGAGHVVGMSGTCPQEIRWASAPRAAPLKAFVMPQSLHQFDRGRCNNGTGLWGWKRKLKWGGVNSNCETLREIAEKLGYRKQPSSRGLLEGEGAPGANPERLQSGWGALYNRVGGSHWRLETRVRVVLGLRTCLRVELIEECCGGGGGPSSKALPSGCTSSGQVAQILSLHHSKGPQAAQLQQAPLNITRESKHEPKAADVVIQFVLPFCCRSVHHRQQGAPTGT